MTDSIFKMPPFYCPLPSMCHPESEDIARYSIEYMDKFELYWGNGQRNRIVGTAPWLCSAYENPLVKREHAQIFSDFLTWAFCYDDEVCDEPPEGLIQINMAQKHIKILRSVDVSEYCVSPEEKYAHAAWDIRVRIDKLFGKSAGDRFSEVLHYYVNAEMHKSVYKIRKELPSLDEQIFLRMYGGGASLFPHVCLLINGLDVDPKYTQDRRLRAMLEMAGLLGGWDNDIYSVHAELTRTDNELNIVDIIARDHKVSLEEGATLAQAMRDRIMDLFIRLGRQLVSESPGEYKPFFTALSYYIRGYFDWTFHTTRYNSVGSDATNLLSGFTDTPMDDRLEPLPIEAIRWWWEYDPLARNG